MADERLTDIERTWLVSIDALLVQTTVDAHGAVAGRFIDLWDSGGPTFRAELAKRALLWRQRHVRVQQVILNSHGACERLVRLMGDPRPPQQNPVKTKPRPRRDRVVPSRRKHTPVQGITEDEAAKFMAMLDADPRRPHPACGTHSVGQQVQGSSQRARSSIRSPCGPRRETEGADLHREPQDPGFLGVLPRSQWIRGQGCDLQRV